MYHELDGIGVCVDLDFHAVYRPAEGVGVVAYDRDERGITV
jgi:hypothetical protein